MSIMTSLFNILALLYIGRAVQLTAQIIRDWAALRQEPLTGGKQRLAEQAAFFIGVPPSVLIHELAHAIAIWLFGGQVVEFGYRVFWGYVVPAGTFTAVQNWIIALAGTLGSLGFGAAIWLALRHNPSRTLQYFGKRAFRFQIYFSLLYYPIFSLFLPIGDWRVIYDFRATPLLSGVFLAVHIASLFWFWRADRRGWFEMPAFETVAEQQAYETVQAAIAGGDEAAQLRAIDDLRRGGARHQARTALTEFIRRHPDSGAAQLQLAALLAEGQGSTGKDAFEAAGRALALGLENPNQVAYARELMASYYLERGDGEAAGAEIDQALANVGSLHPSLQADLHALRSQAYRRQKRYDDAYGELQAAIDLARSTGNAAAIARYTAELEVVEQNARGLIQPPSPQDKQPTYLPPGSG